MTGPLTGLRVGIVGAGPVGMYMALRLHGEGCSVRVFDRRTEIRPHSRSIGIHPPSWNLLDAAGLSDALLERSCTVESGAAFWDGQRVGGVALGQLDGLLVTIPQYRTEEILQSALQTEAPDVLVLGSAVTAVRSDGEGGDHATIHFGRDSESFDLVVGCDGRNSLVREALGAQWQGGSYGIPYVMGDFSDTTGLTGQAAILLGRDGLVESFPLPEGVRRWVVRIKVPVSEGEDLAALLSDVVAGRTPFRIPVDTCTMTSAFGVERYEATPMARGRLFLAGDSAHVVSPIGGQGMNLGWFDAEWLVRALVVSTARGELASGALAQRHAHVRRKAYRTAARRAEFNMWMGAPCSGPSAFTREVLMRAALLPLVQRLFIERFTMSGIG